MLRFIFASSLIFSMTVASHAATITFEGTTTTGATRILDVDGAGIHGPSLIDYAGYDWLGFAVSKPLISVNRPRQITGFELDEGDLIPVTTPVDAGFHRSIVSGDTIAYTQSFGGSSSLFGSIKARPGEANFDFFSTYLTSGWRDNINVTVTGLRDGSTFYTQNLVIGDDAPTLVNLNFLDIDEIRFNTSGGTFLYQNGNSLGSFVNPSNAFSTPVLVFDNMNIAVAAPVPEPEIYAMMALGLGLLGWKKRRGQQQTT